MKRTTTLTLMLMSGSIAAAVAAPGLPGDLAANECGCIEQFAIAPAMAVAAAPPTPVAAARIGVVRETNKVSSQDRLAGCESDVTAPYRHAHHGSLKLDPICPARAAT